MKNKKKIIIALIIVAIVVALSVCLILIFSGRDSTNNNKSLLNKERIMSDGSYQIRFSDLVSLEDLKEYNNKTVTAIGYLSPITSYDGSFGYLMNLPYQTCPYCLPSDTKITNTLAIFAKNGKKINFTEAAVMVRGTLKLEPYTDSYGYSYNYRIVDITIEEADTSELGEKITLYNKLADKQILTQIINILYAVDDNVYYEEYTANGAKYDRKKVDFTNIEKVVKELKEFNTEDVSILIDLSTKLKTIATDVNKLLEQKKYTKLSEYKEDVDNLFYKLGDWMELYQL